MNSRYFNSEKGIFSKLDIDEYIPQEQRLIQKPYCVDDIPLTFPVFIKPEWGQNSTGVTRISDRQSYIDFRHLAERSTTQYIVQEAAHGQKEFEIYYLRSPSQTQDPAFFSITRVDNSKKERYPVNSIYNSSTRYRDITSAFSGDELNDLWQIIGSVGRFRMARVGVKADDREALLRGDFKIIEINLFLPMPLVLLSTNVSRQKKLKLIGETMAIAAKLVKSLPKEERQRWIFFRKMFAQYKIAS